MILDLDFLKEHLDGFRLERSIKFHEGVIFSKRYNFWFDHNFKSNLNSIFKIFDYLENQHKWQFDYSIINHYINQNFDFTKIKFLVFGTDIREKMIDSRVKIWLIIMDYPQKRAELQADPEFTKDLRELAYNDVFLFGFDFNFNGTSKIKLYPAVYRFDLDNPALEKILQKILCNDSLFLMRHTCQTHITTNKQGLVIHFHPQHMLRFIESMALENIISDAVHQNMLDLYSSLPDNRYDDQVLSLQEIEIQNRSISNFSLYKMYSS